MTVRDFDVLVLGGGIQGAGVAQAAAAAGASVLLAEKDFPAAGTSSRSSKLIHGGLRYLESGQFGLVRESLRERAILCRIAPHLVRLVPFLLPVRRGAKRAPWQLRVGLSIYSLLGLGAPGWGFGSIPRRQWEQLDGLRLDDLRAVLRYQDGQTDDAALTRAVWASACELGATAWTQAEFVDARIEDSGVEAVLQHQGHEERVRARVLVNATGPWAEQVAARIQPRPELPAIELVAGSHVELEGPIRQGCYYLEAPQDARGVFVMPWQGRSLVGTTERPYRGDPGAAQPSEAELQYLQEAVQHHFPGRPWRALDAWAGLRVLPRAGGAAFHRSREVLLDCWPQPGPVRVLSVVGGKLTGYRGTAERVMRALKGSLPRTSRQADTATLRLPAPATSPACERPTCGSSARPAPSPVHDT